MADRTTESAVEPGFLPRDPDTDFRRLVGGLAGGVVLPVAGMILAKGILEALGLLERLKQADAIGSTLFPLSFFLVALPLFLVRTRGWLHWWVFLAVSAPLTLYCGAAGTVAGLLRSQLPWGSATAAFLTLAGLAGPVLWLHMRLFDRPPEQAGAEWGADDLAAVALPALLVLAALVDLAEATGAASAIPRQHRHLAVLSAILCTVCIVASGTPQRRRVEAVAATGIIAGTATLAFASMGLAAQAFPAWGPAVAGGALPFLLPALAVRKLRGPIRRRLGLDGPTGSF